MAASLMEATRFLDPFQLDKPDLLATYGGLDQAHGALQQQQRALAAAQQQAHFYVGGGVVQLARPNQHAISGQTNAFASAGNFHDVLLQTATPTTDAHDQPYQACRHAEWLLSYPLVLGRHLRYLAVSAEANTPQQSQAPISEVCFCRRQDVPYFWVRADAEVFCLYRPPVLREVLPIWPD